MGQQPTEQSETHRMGRGMMIAAWAIGLGLLSLLFGGVLDDRRNPNQQIETSQGMDGVREIRLQRNRYGHYHASGTINGEPVEFMLDTGASDVSIPDRVARRVGLERGAQQHYSTANGTIIAYTTMLERVGLGGLELRHIRGSINPHMEGETILLGMSVLKQLEFTQRGDTLIIRQY
ncbi:MAG: TIGR02281 family clan AA aspartic protease [Chromatiales bacterium]|nr:TIGR02281 family clan AA aspartic protease [Chromatiales bacterium]